MFQGEDVRYLRLTVYLNGFYCAAAMILGGLEWFFAFLFSGALGVVYFILLRQRVLVAAGMTKKKAMMHMHLGFVLRIVLIVLAFLLFNRISSDKVLAFFLGLLSYQTVLFVEMIVIVVKLKIFKEGG